MKIKQLHLKNWMNFKSISISDIQDRAFVIGANAVGKSNLLDAVRFLRDVARPAGVKPSGGGLQKAVADRGGISKLRCLNARQDTEVMLDVELEDTSKTRWRYQLGFKGEGKANNRIKITKELVQKDRKTLLDRPGDKDGKDPERLTQTFLEQINSNQEFRDVTHFFSEVTYLHLVPQLLKFANLIGGNTIEQDPFGQGFLQRVAGTPEKTRKARLTRIQKALATVVPQFQELRFVKDELTGLPHIEAKFSHFRPQGAWQREHQFSDGTLRLIGLMWSLQDGNSLLLLEEPELSLNEEIVSHLPRLFYEVQHKAKVARQILITTHSQALLDNRSISPDDVIRLTQGKDGTELQPPDAQERIMLESGLSVSAVLLPATRPQNASQLVLPFK